MRIQKKKSGIVEGDLTPMIDMTFQLIAFFMVLINFTKVEQDQRILIPLSEMAKPPETPYEDPITLQVLEDGKVILRGMTLSMDALRSELITRRQFYQAQGVQPSDIVLIIRADKDLEAQHLQELIEVCQEARFITFALRAQAEEST